MPDTELIEFVCLENNTSLQHLVGSNGIEIKRRRLCAASSLVSRFCRRHRSGKLSDAARHAQTTPVSGLRLNHVGIYVKDFDESMRFYTQNHGLS